MTWALILVSDDLAQKVLVGMPDRSAYSHRTGQPTALKAVQPRVRATAGAVSSTRRARRSVAAATVDLVPQHGEPIA